MIEPILFIQTKQEDKTKPNQEQIETPRSSHTETELRCF